MPQRHRAHRRFCLPLLAVTCSLAATGAVAQERSPYYIGVSQAFTHDSNVYRTLDNEVSETISSTGVLFGVDQRFGRQRFFADASAQTNRYNSDDRLNNKSYAATAELDWETIGFLSGVLRFATRNSLADLGTTGGAASVSDQVTEEYNASVRYGLASFLALEAGYAHRRLDYKNPLLSNRNYSQDTVNAGVNWIVGTKLTLGVGARSTQGTTPEFAPTPPRADELKRRDIDFTAAWRPSAFSTVNARISATRETRSLATIGELSETTGTLSWDYAPTSRLNFTTSLSRDTGTETTFLGTAPGGTTALQADRNRISNSLSLDARYTLTGKTSLRANVRQRDGSSSDSTDDTTRGYSLAVSYLPTRTISLSCNVMREQRRLAGATAYNATVTGCSGELTLR